MSKQVFDRERQGELMGMNKKCIKNKKLSNIQRGLDKDKMITESLYSIASTLGGSFFGSFLIGYFIKKIIKILMFILGGILALLMYLQSQGIISVEVNSDKIQSSMEALVSTIVANTANIPPSDGNSSIVGSNLGIPLTGSIASGFMLGITRRG